MRTTLLSFAAGALILTSAALFTASCFSGRGIADVTVSDGALCKVPENATVDGSTIVVIRNYAFHPSIVRIRRGERVTWVNCESTVGLSHTSNANAGAWASGLIAPAMTFTRAFDAAGSFEYHCDPHPFMTGSVVVE